MKAQLSYFYSKEAEPGMEKEIYNYKILIRILEKILYFLDNQDKETLIEIEKLSKKYRYSKRVIVQEELFRIISEFNEDDRIRKAILPFMNELEKSNKLFKYCDVDYIGEGLYHLPDRDKCERYDYEPSEEQEKYYEENGEIIKFFNTFANQNYFIEEKLKKLRENVKITNHLKPFVLPSVHDSD